MTKQGKVWGETTEFFRNALASAHHLSIKKGGYCSKHSHTHKHNLFYVISGLLKISIWRLDTEFVTLEEDITIIALGQSAAVPPGFFHKFEALEDTECIEVYQVFLEDPDIERETMGGMRSK